MKGTENNLIEFYRQIQQGDQDLKKSGSRSFSLAEEATNLSMDIADGGGAPSLTSIITAGKMAAAGKDEIDKRDARHILKTDLKLAKPERIDAVSEIADLAFERSGTIPKGNFWGDYVDIGKRAEIYSGIFQALDAGMGKGPIDDGAKAKLVETMANHLKKSKDNTPFILNVGKEGGINHISFKTGEIEKTKDILTTALGNTFKDTVNIGLKDDKKEDKYTGLEDDETAKKPTNTSKTIKTHIELSHEQAKAGRYLKGAEAAAGIVDVTIAAGVAAGTHGAASPMLGQVVLDVATSVNEAKRNQHAVVALSFSINSATPHQLEAADAIVEGAFLSKAFAGKKEWRDRIDVVKKAEIYDAVLRTLEHGVDESKIEDAKDPLTKNLQKILEEGKSNKPSFLNIGKNGGMKEHISLKEGVTEKLFNNLLSSIGEKYKGGAELEGNEPKELSRSQQRKANIEEGTAKSDLPDHLRKEVSQLGKDVLNEAKKIGDKAMNSGNNVENTEDKQKTNKETLLNKIIPSNKGIERF
jgi:hypothetical protein